MLQKAIRNLENKSGTRFPGLRRAYNRTQSRGKKKQRSLVKRVRIKTVSYNISWAVGEKISAGSEKQFIEDNTCLEQNHCRQRQMLSLQKLAKKKSLQDGGNIFCIKKCC